TTFSLITFPPLISSLTSNVPSLPSFASVFIIIFSLHSHSIGNLSSIIMVRFVVLVVTFLLTSTQAFAQGSMLLQQPTGSQSHIVFVHANDLWVVDRSGGDARRLTSAIGAEVNPRLSP